MLAYLENPKESTKKLTELISELNSYCIKGQYTKFNYISIY